MCSLYLVWQVRKYQNISAIYCLCVSPNFFQKLCASRGEQPLTHQGFHELLSAELCGASLDVSAPKPDGERCHHTPVAIAPDNNPTKKATAGRKKCKLCGRNTPFQCRVCRVPMCVILDINCHDDFHNGSL